MEHTYSALSSHPVALRRGAARRWVWRRVLGAYTWLEASVRAGASDHAAPIWTVWGLASALCCGVTGVLLAAGAACLWVVGVALAHGVTVVAALGVVPETLLALAGALVVWRSTAATR